MWWSKGESPSAALGSSMPRSRRAAIAMPTALPMPWPSGPVVVSTPAVWPNSGWPGVFDAPGAQRLEVVELESPATEVELDVERQAGVAAREHEAVTAGPVRIGGVVPHDLLEQQVRRGGQAHGRAGVAVADLLHGVHRQDADRVDGLRVEFAPVERGQEWKARGSSRTITGRHRRAYSCRGLDSTPHRPPSREVPTVSHVGRSASLPCRRHLPGDAGSRRRARVVPGRRRGVRRADQAARHRAAAAHHRAR